jgi:DNA-binding transcriptional regulator YdaS (Cro superfamily)
MRKRKEKPLPLLTCIEASEANNISVAEPLIENAAETTIAAAAETITAPGGRKRGRPPAPMVDPAAGFRVAAKAVGGVPALARLLNVREQTPYQWGRIRIPAERIIEIERLTGVPRELLRPDLYRTKGRTAFNEAIAVVKAAGYHVKKPRKSKQRPKKRVGPTFVAEFADGVVTRMSTFTSLEKLDWNRGERLAQAAYESRWRTRVLAQYHKQNGGLRLTRWQYRENAINLIAPVPPAIIAEHFEQDGKVLAQRASLNLDAVDKSGAER